MLDELERLKALLDDNNIEYKFIFERASNPKYNRRLVKLYDNYGSEVLSAICHYGSYGYEQGKIEIMGLLTKEEAKHDSVVGWLDAKNVFERIKKYLKENENV